MMTFPELPTVTDVVLDQAAGLRRLLAQSALRTIAVASVTPGAGRTMVAANLAILLARQGRNVLLLDCAKGNRSAAALLGVRPGRDLLEAIEGAANPATLAVEGRSGVRVVRAPALVDALEQPRRLDAARLSQVLDRVREGADLLLVDAPAADLAWSSAAGELILLVASGPEALTGSYGLIKRLHADGGLRRVHILVARPHSSAHADRIFGNLSATSRRFLNLPLESVGHILNDEHVLRATRLRQPVVEAFPDADSAQALRDCAAAVLRTPHSGETACAEFANRLIETARSFAATGS